MLTLSSPSSLTSKWRLASSTREQPTNQFNRQNPAVFAKAQQVFHHIALALEAEMIQGQTAKKVAESAKAMVTQSGINADQVLQTLSPDGQATVRSYFS